MYYYSPFFQETLIKYQNCLERSETMKQKPNILFIMTDQQRYDCVGINGNPIIRTPNIDALALQGANMQNCFVQAPVCVPSRQTIFTGRYPHSHKNRVNYTPLDPNETLLQAYLKQAGYNTAFVGKLHYHPPTRDYALSTGFDKGLIHDAAHTDPHSDYYAWLKNEAPQYTPDYRRCKKNETGNPFIAEIPEQYHETTWCGEQSRAMLKDLSDKDKPFFLFSSYWKPHSPFEVPEPWATFYDQVDIPLPSPEDAATISQLPQPVQTLALRNSQPAYQITRETLQWMYRAYYAAVTQIDYQIGLTLQALEDLHQKENTIVIFISDHGDQLGEHGIIGKNVFYESSIHVPLIIRFPSCIKPGEYPELVEGTDILGTVFEIADIPVPYSNQGNSFSFRITGGKVGQDYQPRKYVFAENIIPEVINWGELDYPYIKGKGVGGIKHPDAKMVRTSQWKYTRYVGHGEELYNIEEDREEHNNLANNAEYKPLLQNMRSALIDWLITADESDQIAQRWLFTNPDTEH
jgi:arylsulfatase A-like enzyme